MADDSLAKYAATKRSNLISTWALVWIRQHRPDVLQVFWAEAEKLYPQRRLRQQRKNTPAWLQELK